MLILDYTRLSEIPVRYEQLGSDVEILHIILLKNSNREIIAQLQFRNLSDSCVKSLVVSIKYYNEMGEPLNNGIPFEFTYQDLNVKRGEKFGDRVPVQLPDIHTRNIDVLVEKYLLSDETIHSRTEFEERKIPDGGKHIPQHLLDSFEQNTPMELKTRFTKTTYPFITSNGWVCSCGKYNVSTHVRGVGLTKARLKRLHQKY